MRHALVCTPSNTLNLGLRKEHRGEVNVPIALRQHATYCRALESFGFTLHTLPSDPLFPDSTFVEDAAITFRDILIIPRLCPKTRQGEEPRVCEALAQLIPGLRVGRIEPPGFVEGGDVLITKDKLFIGLSGRTNEEGARQLARLAFDLAGYSSQTVEIPESGSEGRV